MVNRGKLYIVATPIGNLQDMTLRAIDVLNSVDLILAEDTRHCARLLEHYQIATKTSSFHNFNESAHVDKILSRLTLGESFALISDAGTPLISDPGWLLVNMARKAGLEVVAVPGPCALIAGLSIVGLPTQKFQFFGFPPAKSAARQKSFKDIIPYTGTSIFYESPHRIVEMLTDCCHVLGEERVYGLAKELTKLFETVRTGSCTELLAWLKEKPEHVKGEFVVFVGPSPLSSDYDFLRAQALLRTMLPYMSLKVAVKIAAEHCHVNKNRLYNFALSVSSE